LKKITDYYVKFLVKIIDSKEEYISTINSKIFEQDLKNNIFSEHKLQNVIAQFSIDKHEEFLMVKANQIINISHEIKSN